MSAETEHLNATDYCSWWVITASYPCSGAVHLPGAIETGGGNDPDTEPPAETLCTLDRRRESRWRVKSHAVLPPGFRDECGHCHNRLQEVIARER